jgi:hypothetical protein
VEVVVMVVMVVMMMLPVSAARIAEFQAFDWMLKERKGWLEGRRCQGKERVGWSEGVVKGKKG